MTTTTDPRYTQAGYITVRKSWQDHIEMFGLTKCRERCLTDAFQLWVTNAPQIVADDDWVDAAGEWHRTHLAA